MKTEGKKIDEIKIGWDSILVVRYHSDDLSFTVEAGDRSFDGEDLKELVEKGKVHLKGWSDLKWEKMIAIDQDLYGKVQLGYRRCFQSKHKGQLVYRCWKIGKENEGEFGGLHRNPETGDDYQGEPGAVMGSMGSKRMIPYTEDRWDQIRRLGQGLDQAMEHASKKLEELLAQKDINGFLEKVQALPASLTFTVKK